MDMRTSTCADSPRGTCVHGAHIRTRTHTTTGPWSVAWVMCCRITCCRSKSSSSNAGPNREAVREVPQPGGKTGIKYPNSHPHPVGASTAANQRCFKTGGSPIGPPDPSPHPGACVCGSPAGGGVLAFFLQRKTPKKIDSQKSEPRAPRSGLEWVVPGGTTHSYPLPPTPTPSLGGPNFKNKSLDPGHPLRRPWATRCGARG